MSSSRIQYCRNSKVCLISHWGPGALVEETVKGKTKVLVTVLGNEECCLQHSKSGDIE